MERPRFRRITNGDLLVSGQIVAEDRDHQGTVIVPAALANEWLEQEISAKADQLLKIMVEQQRHSLLPEEESC